MYLELGELNHGRVGLQLSKVDRRLLHDGGGYLLECAVEADEVSSPADTTLTELEQGFWDDPTTRERPDKSQVSVYARFLVMFEELAEYGVLEIRDSYNSLNDGMWELKAGNVRLSFFDTDGAGNFTPKLGEKYFDWRGKSQRRLPEQFDEYIRFGHTFAKVGEKAPESDVVRAKDLRDEDVQHDNIEAPVSD